jgi:hypothetical protein
MAEAPYTATVEASTEDVPATMAIAAGTPVLITGVPSLVVIVGGLPWAEDSEGVQ